MKCLPISQDTNKNLANNDTADLQVVNSLDPCFIANFVGFPARGESCSEKGFDIADGKQDVSRRQVSLLW